MAKLRVRDYTFCYEGHKKQKEAGTIGKTNHNIPAFR